MRVEANACVKAKIKRRHLRAASSAKNVSFIFKFEELSYANDLNYSDNFHIKMTRLSNHKVE